MAKSVAAPVDSPQETSAATVVAKSAAAPDVSPQESSGQDATPLITRAAAFRCKYRKHESVRLLISQVGFHPANREGQPPSSARCCSLLQEILDIGFDVGEANAGGVVVEAGSTQATLEQFNTEACEGDERLAPVVMGSIRYGALSHNHLNQILKNIAAAAAADIPQVCDGAGKLSLAKLRSVDAAFANAVDCGLTWEVLSESIMREEPHAVDVIQSALNAKNGTFLLVHEMQAISKLSAVTSALTVVGQQVAWQSVRDRMRETMPQFAEDEHFLELFRFVVDLGAHAAPFITDLRNFHDKFVDPKLRKVRTSTFALFNMIPEKFSFTKVAAVKHVCSCPPYRVQHGYCEPIPKSTLKRILEEKEFVNVMSEGEDVLCFFHGLCSSALAALVKADKTRFLGNLDRDIFKAVLGQYGGRCVNSVPTGAMRLEDVHTIAQKFHTRLASMVKQSSDVELPPLKDTWQNAKVSQPSIVPAASKLESKVLLFDKCGRPLSAQDTAVGSQEEDFQWKSFSRLQMWSPLLRRTALDH